MEIEFDFCNVQVWVPLTIRGSAIRFLTQNRPGLPRTSQDYPDTAQVLPRNPGTVMLSIAEL